MLFGLRYLADDLQTFLILFAALVVAFIVGIGFHEFSHALTAKLQGDDTPERMGRLTLNPIRHLDAAGTVLLLLVGFGWGKPVSVNPYNFRSGPRTGSAVVAAAGPISNLVMAALAALPIRLGLVPLVGSTPASWWTASDYVGLFLFFVIFINIVLALFNLIPVAPLDGFKVALGVLPLDLARSLQRLEPYGMGILMILIALPWLTNGSVDVIGGVLGPAREEIFQLLTQA